MCIHAYAYFLVFMHTYIATCHLYIAYTCMHVHDRYFSLQATEPLFMGDKVRMDIENKICDVQGPRADSYTTAQKIAFDTMNKV